jgi:DNA repair exonuclease SbcCD ATPase subunit
MAKNAITVLNEGKKSLDELNGKLKKTIENVLAINDAALKTGKNFFNVNSPKQLNNSLKTNKTYVEQLNAELKERKRLEKAIESQLQKNKFAETNINKALIKTRYEYQQLNKRSKEAAVLSSKLSTEYQKQSLKLNQLRKKYKDVALSQGESSKQAKKLLIQITALDNRLKKVDANVGQFQRSVGNYGKAMNSAVGAARNLAGALGFVGGAFLAVRVIKDAFNRVREFDKAMQNIAGIMRTTRSEIIDLEQEIIRVAGSSVKTSREVANLAENLVTLGKTKNEIKELLEPVNNLAIGLETTSGEAAEFLVQTLNAFGAGSEEAGKYADVIATIRTSTTLDFQKMRDSFQYLTPISKILNKDLAYTGAVIGILADNGLKAEQSGRLLGTAQQKLAKEGKSLADALEEVNNAQERGVKEVELLKIASDLFGKQAAKVGIILANNSRELEINAQAIRDNTGALDDLVNEQLESLDAKIKILDSTWEKFILNLDNGNGKLSKAFSNIIEFITGAIEGMNRLNQTQEEYNKSRESDIYNRKLKEQRDLYNDLGETAERVALERADRSRDEIDDINKQIKSLKERNEAIQKGLRGEGENVGNATEYSKNNKEVAKLIEKRGLYNAVLKASEEVITIEAKSIDKNTNSIKNNSEEIVRNVQYLNNQIGIQKEALKLATNRDEAKVVQEKINKLKNELKLILGSNKVKKETKQLIEGTISSYEKLISELENERDSLATNTREYESYNKQIEISKNRIKDLKEGLKSVNKLTSESIDTDFELPENSEIKNRIDYEIELNKEKYEILKELGSDFYEFLNELGLGNIDDIKNLSKEELSVLKDAFDLQKELRRDLQDEVQNIIFTSVDAIFQKRIEDTEREIDLNNERYARLLDDERLSEEQRDALEAERDKKNIELEKKKEKREKEAFLVSQGLAVAEIAINLARTIGAINLAAASIDAITLGIGGAIYRATNIPLAVGTAALQTGVVLAQSIPAFAEGKNLKDNYEGLAVWGEKRRELKISKDGSLELSPKKIDNHLTHVKKDDVIIPDANKFLSNLSDEELYNNLHKHSILASIAHQKDTLNNYLINKSIDRQTDRLLKAFKDNKPRVNVHNNINSNIGDDLKFLTRLSKTL